MSINGIDVTARFSAICGTILFILYIGFSYFVINHKPKNKSERRWKASLLVGALPILGIPILLGIISAVAIFQADFSKMDFVEFISKLLVIFTVPLACFFPLTLLLSIFATIGTHKNFELSDYWLNKIVPPSKDEKPNVHDWL